MSKTLGKGPNTLGKAFAECHTRQRAHGKILAGKEVFAECFLSGTRQRLCRVPTLGKEKNKKKPKNRKKNCFFGRATHQLAPASAPFAFFSFFSTKSTNRPRAGFEPATVSSRSSLLHHCTMITLRCGSSCIILNYM